MSLKEEILAAQSQAMKEKKTAELSTLRMVLASIKNAEIKKQAPLSDEEVQDELRRQVKQLQDPIADFEKAGRTELVEQNQQEIAVLNRYLPAQLSEEEIRTKIATIIEQAGAVQMGQAMGLVMNELKGQADGNLVRTIVSEIIQS